MWLEVTADLGADATQTHTRAVPSRWRAPPGPLSPAFPARRAPLRKRDWSAQPSARAVKR